ncbi:MAG: hypothetical protein CMI16_06465 [Opitutaceae bacterium]|nr:hypothetical protein [Opitutaceae bacterium]
MVFIVSKREAGESLVGNAKESEVAVDPITNALGKSDPNRAPGDSAPVLLGSANPLFAVPSETRQAEACTAHADVTFCVLTLVVWLEAPIFPPKRF